MLAIGFNLTLVAPALFRRQPSNVDNYVTVTKLCRRSPRIGVGIAKKGLKLSTRALIHVQNVQPFLLESTSGLSLSTTARAAARCDLYLPPANFPDFRRMLLVVESKDPLNRSPLQTA